MSIDTTDKLAPTATRAEELKAIGSGTRSLGSAGTTDLLNISVAGQLLGIAVRVSTAPGSTPTARINVNVDGAGAVNLPLYTAANVWGDDIQNLSLVGDGDAVGDRFFLPLSLSFETSLIVQLETTSAGSGELKGSAVYGEKI